MGRLFLLSDLLKFNTIEFEFREGLVFDIELFYWFILTGCCSKSFH